MSSTGAERAIYPTAPLLAAIKRIAAEQGFDIRPHPDHNAPGIGAFAKAVFHDDGLMTKLRQLGRITPTKADNLACKLGLHPYEIWGEDWLVPFPSDRSEEAVHRAAQRKYRDNLYYARKQRESRDRRLRKEPAA